MEYNGCVISEYPIGEKAKNHNLVERDRIQSALSNGVIVIETTENGGTMHTVSFASKQKKTIGCLKHPDQMKGFDFSSGNELLISTNKAISIIDLNELTNFFDIVFDDKKQGEYEKYNYIQMKLDV